MHSSSTILLYYQYYIYYKCIHTCIYHYYSYNYTTTVHYSTNHQPAVASSMVMALGKLF